MPKPDYPANRAYVLGSYAVVCSISLYIAFIGPSPAPQQQRRRPVDTWTHDDGYNHAADSTAYRPPRTDTWTHDDGYNHAADKQH